MNIAVVGTGYVGLVTGTCLAEVGNTVMCVDVDEAKVKKMQAGVVPIYEPGLELIFSRNIQEGRLSFTTTLAEGIADAEAIFLALPTPPNGDGSADLSFVLKVADDLGPLLKNYAVIIDKSTVPVGTADKVRERIARGTKLEFDVASNPEFLQEGLAVANFMEPDRIVVGTESARARKVMEEIYEPFIRQGSELFFMDERSAEMTKYAANSYLATRISFMNEVANLCEKVGANVDAVRVGIGSDPRIGKRFLFAGIGYGGSCFPKDVKALRHIADENDYDFKIMSAVDAVNNRQKKRLVQKVLDHFDGDVQGKHFALWGLAFKPNTDDIREAPALEIVADLIAKGAKITAYDPEAIDNVRKLGLGENLRFGEDEYEVLTNADALVIATEWPLFGNSDFDIIKSSLKQPVIFDGRNMFDPQAVRDHGFTYYSIGRP